MSRYYDNIVKGLKNSDSHDPARSNRLPAPHLSQPAGGRGAPAPEAKELDGLLNFWAIFRRKKLLILAVSVMGALTGFSITLPKPVLYKANAVLEVQIFNENFMGMGQVDPQAGSYSPTDANIRTHIEILKSASLHKDTEARLAREMVPSLPPTPEGILYRLRNYVLRNVLRRAQQDPLAAMAEALQMASASVDARSMMGTRIIYVTCESTHPEVAAGYVNTLANEFIDRSLSARLQSIQGMSKWMTGQLEEHKTKAEKSEEQLQQFLRSGGRALVASATEPDILKQTRVQQLEQTMAALQADRQAKQTAYQQAQASSIEAFVTTPEGGGLRALHAKLMEMERTLADLGKTLQPEHSRVKALKAQMEELQLNLDSERTIVIARLRKEFEDAERREKLQTASYNRETQNMRVDSEKLIEYNLMKRQVDLDRQLYQALMHSINQADFASAVPANNIRVIDPAQVNLQPILTRTWVMNTSLGLTTGMLLVMTWCVLRLKTNQRLVAPGDASSLLNVPEIGVIPNSANGANGRRWLRPPWARLGSTDRIESAEADAVELQWSREGSVFADSFRGTLASLIDPSADGSQVFVVTSPAPREGKSTIASNLAMALAEAQRRVLLVDADLRSPRQHRLFNVNNDWGLADALRDTADLETLPLESIVRATEIPGVFVLPSGPVTAHPGKLFFSARLLTLLGRLRKEFDHVIVDTPPILTFTDARILARLADGVILVLRSGNTGRDSAVAARQLLSDDRVVLRGTILNDWQQRGKDYKYHYAGEYGKKPNG